MIKRYAFTALTGFMAIVLLNWSCTKLDTTTLGGDILPVVDNINTFADTFEIITSQGFFNDTTKTYRTTDHVLGKITSDPLFGTTEASIYFQPKPGFFPFYFGSRNDTIIGFDSVVLCLNYRGHWGNTDIPQHLQVSTIPPNAGGEWDSLYKPHYITFAPPTGQVIGEKTIDIKTLGNYQKFAHNSDSAQNQIRIKLDSTWGASLFFQDSSASGSPNNALYKDSIFRSKFKGVAVKTISGEALMYTSLTDPKTRLEFHFRKRRNNVVDTVFSNLGVIVNEFGSVLPSATANKFIRDRSTGQYPPAGPADEIFLQTQPGTFASLSIPELNIFKDTNRIIHNARIRLEQVPHNFQTDSVFSPPPYLYLDLRDTTLAETYKPVYMDLNPSVLYNPDYLSSNLLPFYPGSVEFGYFGGFRKNRVDALSGRSIAYYEINLTRYIQRMVINDAPNYNLRLFAPYTFSYPQFSPDIIAYNNSLGVGRIKLGGNAGGGTNPYRMKMIVVYSKLPE